MSEKQPFKSLGQTIRLLRREKGWSQFDAASQLAISVPAFSKIESGATDINLSRIEQIAHLFGMQAVGLISLSDNGHQPITINELHVMQQRLSERESEIMSLQQKIITLFAELNDNQKQ
jgi:transcriptional regulator with XRE-family HTH domain